MGGDGSLPLIRPCGATFPQGGKARAVVGGNDFLQAVSNVDTTAALNVLDELMSALYVANPKVYNGVMRKLERLRNE